jgi:hypothetical protein
MKRSVIFVIAALALISGAGPQQQTAIGQPSGSQPGQYIGVATCVNSGCHGSTVPLRASRVRQNEYYTWLNNDRHAQAFNVLYNERSARIARNMKLRGRAFEEKICLDCHTTNIPASRQAVPLDLEDGVQCEACHGPASGWRDEHIQGGWTHEQSVARGLVDLRDISTRANLCLSCHLGNSLKEVDHDLIGAGHPILAFELDNYAASMPPHWNPNDSHGLRAFAVGQAVKLSEHLENLSRHARGDKWPEFSDMSCFNCHHDLKDSQWRQVRGWPGRPGLPSWSPQHWVVTRHLVGRVSPSARTRLDRVMPQLAASVAKMNDRTGVTRNADEARAVINGVISQMERLTWSDAEVRSLMNAIAADEDSILRSDVHAAEQAALALQSLGTTLSRRNPRLVGGQMMRSIDALFSEVRSRDDYDPRRFAQKMRTVRATL